MYFRKGTRRLTAVRRDESVPNWSTWASKNVNEVWSIHDPFARRAPRTLFESWWTSAAKVYFGSANRYGVAVQSSLDAVGFGHCNNMIAVV
jgi:hypothetical protein